MTDSLERLAEAAVHSTETTIHLLGDAWPKGVEADTDQAAPPPPEARAQWTVDYPSRQPRSGKSLLQIYAEVLSSEALKPVPYDEKMMINDRIVHAGEGERGEALHTLARQWSLSDEELKDGPGGWESKVEELAILATLLACGSGRKGQKPRVDFFLVSHSAHSGSASPGLAADEIDAYAHIIHLPPGLHDST